MYLEIILCLYLYVPESRLDGSDHRLESSMQVFTLAMATLIEIRTFFFLFLKKKLGRHLYYLHIYTCGSTVQTRKQGFHGGLGFSSQRHHLLLPQLLPPPPTQRLDHLPRLPSIRRSKPNRRRLLLSHYTVSSSPSSSMICTAKPRKDSAGGVAPPEKGSILLAMALEASCMAMQAPVVAAVAVVAVLVLSNPLSALAATGRRMGGQAFKSHSSTPSSSSSSRPCYSSSTSSSSRPSYSSSSSSNYSLPSYSSHSSSGYRSSSRSSRYSSYPPSSSSDYSYSQSPSSSSWSSSSSSSLTSNSDYNEKIGASTYKPPSSCANCSFVKDTDEQNYCYSQSHAESYSSKNPPVDEVLCFAGFLVFLFLFLCVVDHSLYTFQSLCDQATGMSNG